MHSGGVNSAYKQYRIPAYNLFVIAGQSNTYYGTALDAALDTTHQDIFEFTQAGTVVPANDPLDHFPGRTAGRIGFAMTFAKAYGAVYPSAKVLLVPCGLSGAGFSTSAPDTWAAGNGTLRQRTINRVNAALAALPGSTLKGILWQQGESDTDDGTEAAAYEAQLDALIADLRSSITGASAVPFIAGGLPTAWVGSDPNRLTVQAAIAAIASRNSKAAFVNVASPTELALSDGLHFTAAAQRLLGPRYYDAYIAALADA